MVHAGVYSGMLHYLKACAALGGTPDGKSVAAQMKSLPTDDPLFGKGTVRSDGRKLHDAYVYEVKSSSASRYPGDLYATKATIPAEEAFRPLNGGGCALSRG
jgi:branched-chain amino acid transport system substrate-binding protein